MIPNSIEKLYKLLDEIPITTTNRAQVNHIKELLDNNEFEEAISELQNLKYDLSEDSESRRDSSLRAKKRRGIRRSRRRLRRRKC